MRLRLLRAGPETGPETEAVADVVARCRSRRGPGILGSDDTAGTGCRTHRAGDGSGAADPCRVQPATPGDDVERAGPPSRAAAFHGAPDARRAGGLGRAGARRRRQ